jgi:hypothetical protein
METQQDASKDRAKFTFLHPPLARHLWALRLPRLIASDHRQNLDPAGPAKPPMLDLQSHDGHAACNREPEQALNKKSVERS